MVKCSLIIFQIRLYLLCNVYLAVQCLQIHYNNYKTFQVLNDKIITYCCGVRTGFAEIDST